MKLQKLVRLIALIGASAPALAQEVVATAPLARVKITGSSIKRIAREGALPIETITRKQLDEQGIVSAEQLVATLNINGNGSDNLASNADVTTGAARGNNGASSANLRGQGADSTLILLNGRRVATHGMLTEKRPVLTLMATSHSDIALTKTSFSRATRARAANDRRESPSSNQTMM